MTDDYSPRFVGDTGNPLRATFVDGSSVAYSLSGATLALSLINLNASERTATLGTGTWTIVDAANGIAQYAWSSADVANAGIYGIEVTVTFPGGPVTFQQKTLEMRRK
jgi:hypothetical protein